MKKILATVWKASVGLLLAVSIFGQSDYTPRLKQSTQKFTDEVINTEFGRAIQRRGENLQIPVGKGASLQLELTSPLSTKGMNEVAIYRDLPLRNPIQAPLGGLYVGKDVLVQTRIVGKSAGTFHTSWLLIQPELIRVKITSYIKIADNNGMPVYLAPGVWELKLSCSLRSIEMSDGRSWYAKDDAENAFVQGKKFGFEQSNNDRYGSSSFTEGLYLIPGSQFISLGIYIWKPIVFLFRRPNLQFPRNTELFFAIDGIQATQVAGQIPTFKNPTSNS